MLAKWRLALTTFLWLTQRDVCLTWSWSTWERKWGRPMTPTKTFTLTAQGRLDISRRYIGSIFKAKSISICSYLWARHHTETTITNHGNLIILEFLGAAAVAHMICLSVSLKKLRWKTSLCFSGTFHRTVTPSMMGKGQSNWSITKAVNVAAKQSRRYVSPPNSENDGTVQLTI